VIHRCKAIIVNKKFFYGVLLVAMLVQTFPFGLRYFPFSDDWFSLGMFSMYRSNIWSEAVLRYGLHGFRPLAGLLEVYVLSAFWPNMWIVLLGMVLLRFFAILMLDNILEKCKITWGRAATVFFAFFPTLTESTYWLSASVRIVAGSFLSILAAYAILNFINRENRKQWLVIAIVCGFFANGFYEQGIIFTFVLTMGVMLINYRKIKSKLLFIWPFANLATIGVHYIVFRDVNPWLNTRAGVEQNIFRQFPQTLSVIGRTFVREQAPTVSRSFRWGFEFLFREHLILVLIVIVLSVTLAIFVAHDSRENNNKLRSVFVAIILFACTLSVFFVITSSDIFVRNFYYSLIGLAILGEVTVRFIPWRAVKAALAGLMIFVFLSGYILEVDTLRRIEHYDSKIIANLVDELDCNNDIWLFGVRWVYSPSINPRYTSQIRIDWAATAHFRYVYKSRNGTRPTNWITPVMSGYTVTLDFTERNVFGILPHTQDVKRLEFDGHNLLIADTGEIFGYLEPASYDRFVFRIVG